MSRLSDAIDANRNRATGQTGGSTGLQKAGRPTGTQGTSSTKTTQTSSRTGGGSVLSQAIDRARSGETVERATGVQLPQSFRGLTDTQRSGVSTTPSALSLFQNRFNRDSGGSRTATTTQRRTTAGGFYSMPDFGAESQRLESAARTAQSAMNAKKTELEGAYSAMTELEKSAQFYGQQAQSIYETFLQNQDPTWGSLFERASANYERANQEYSAAAETFNTLYSEYEPLLNSYNQAAEAYNQYVGGQQEQYSAWRSTIRSQDAIQQDIAATDAAIQELTSQRNNLNRQKSNANRYRGIGLEEGADEKIKSMDAQVEDLEATKTLLQEELEWSQYFRYADLTQAEDFAELSQYRSTANGQEPEFNAWSGMYTETGFDDINYDIINRNEEAMGHQMVNDIQTNASFLGLDNSERKQMTDEEIAIFNYLYAQDTARGDTEHSTAYGYIDYLTGDLNYRQRQADEQAWAEYARESPVASSVFSVITSPLKGLSYLGQAADYLEDREIDQNAGYNKFSYMNSAIRDEVTGIVEDKWGGVGSFAYNTGMSMADFLFNTAVSGGNQAVALAIMGTGAAADTTIDAKDRGLSDDQAFALGTIAGAAEIITEKVSLDRLFNADWEKGALKYILGNAFTEGSEEVASDTINLFADILIAKDKSEWQTSIDAYMEQGMTREEAMGKAVADQAAQMGLDFLGGAISGGVMSGGASVGNAVSTYNTGRALNRMNLEEGDLQAIIQEGLASDPSTRSYQEAVRLQQQMEQGKTPGTYQLGSLYRANIRAIDAEQQGAELLQRARQELDERGSVRNGTARSILENVNAVNTLTAQAGLNLTDSMNQRQRREAVKQAINNFSTSTETDVETGSDTGVQQTEGVVLPTAEDLENQNQQAAEVQTDAAVDTTTEPGMLPTAEQLEVQQRLERASTDLERSGIQAGAREENIQTVQRLSDILGRNIRFYDGRTREAGDPSGAANGYYDLDEDTIYVNSRSRNPVAQIVSHELTHSVETADAYADLSELVLNRIQQTGGNLEQLRREKAELYARRGARLPSQKAIDQEIVANYVERYLLTDEQSIRELTQQNRSLGQRILSWLNQLLAKLGNASAQERAFLTQARDTYARALQQTQTSFNQQTQQAAPAAGQSTQQTTGPPIMEGGGTAQVQEQQTRPAEETRRAEPEAAQEAQEGRRRQPVSEPDPEAQRRRSEAQDALEGLREDYAAGRITEEEFDAALDAIMEEEGLAGEEMLEQYSIDENYERDIDEWDAQGRPDGEVFILGSTGDVLQGLGAMEQDIYLRSEKVNTILQQHPEMTLAEIKRIPEILDDPVLVLKSRNVGRGGQQNTRLVLFGTVRAENGQPVLAVLDLRPVENGLAIDDMQKVTSSYTKDSNPVWYVQNSDILHADKNRTIPLLRTIGFQMPIELQRSGSMGSISYNRQNVNIQGVPFDQVVDTTQQQEDGGGWRYSFGGRNANAADLDALNRAQEMERQGVAMDTIFRETGWYTGADGKWRFEIDDSGMEYSRWGDLRREDRAEFARFRELEGKFIDGSITMDEQNELRQLLEEGHGAGRAEEQQTLRLPDFVRHDELYQNYPQLRQAGLRFTRLPEGTRGTFDGQDIVLDESLRSAPEDTLVHEIQHAIQRAEGFTGGASPEGWQAVPLDEILAAVVPDTMDAELRSELEGAGVPTITYPEGDTQRRMEAVNSVEGAKFSISEEEDAAPERRDTQEDERVFITPRGVEVVRNPTDQEYQQMRDEAYQDYPWLWGTGEPVLRHTYDRQGNEYYWRADQAVHAQVEPYINQRYGTQTSQQWQWWTREDADEWPTDYGRQYSVEEEAQLPTAAEEESRDIIGTMPVKAQQYLRRAESYLTAKVGNLLSVPRYAQREYLRDIVREISLEYLREGRVSGETINELFDRAYDEGVVVDREFYDQYEELRNYLRTVKLTISPEDSADIADFNDFRKSNFGRLNISTQGGTNIDRVYQELESMWPEFFSEERQSNPSDQLQHIADVAQSFQVVERNLDEYYGPEAAEFRRWARHDFEAAVNDALSELNRVRRYVQERETQATTAEAVPTTQAEVTEMWGQLKQARRTYEKTAARNLLTQHDQVQVGRLLRGEIELEHLNEKTDNVKGIREVYQAKLEYERLTRLIRQWNQSRKAALRQQADRYLQTANDWKDKKAGILYSRETMERNIRDIVKDATLAEEINQTYFTPVHDAAAAANRMKNQYRDRVRDLNLSRNVAKGNTVSEAHAVQLLGEAEDNIRILEQSRGRLKERDGKSLEDWRGIVNDLWEENPNLDAEKIRAAVAQFRTIYDELFQQMNEVRVRNGYEPVNYRSGYFPHFQPGNGDGILAQFGKALGIDTEVTALPTTINGLTHTFRPGIRWFGNAQERLGFNTAYDAVEGFDRYIEGVADVIHQTDNIQRLRALASQARYRTGDEGIRKQVDEVRANPNLTEEDKQNRIEKIYETGRFALSNFVVELEEYTNLLANKKSRADRNMEQALGRNMYNLVKALEGRVAANMVAVNPASWLTNFIPLTQGGALLDRGMLLKGMWDTLKAYKVDDGIVDKSSFLTNRRGSDPLVRTWAQKASATASRPMEYIDHFVADSLVRARYRQNLGKNMSEDAAMSEADAWVAGVMADRSKGSTPTLFNRSNPITKVFTQFQLEVNNQLSYLFKDMPKDVKDKGIAALAAALLKFFLGAWLFDEVYEYVIGRRPALDPIGILNDTVGDLTGYELPNLVELGVGAVSGNLPSFEVEQTGLSEAGANLAGTVAETLPFIGGVLGGGRVPISSAIPNLGNLWNALTNEDWSAEKRLQEVRDELLEKPLVYLGLPFGGGQLKKIYEGIEGVIQGGSYSVNAEGEQELQYPIYNDTPAQAIGNALLAATFGRTSLPTGRDWIEGGFDTLGAKQTAVYQGLLEAGVPGEEAYALLKELRGAEKTETESEAAQERRLLQEADISGDGKSIVYYGLMASDRERELMDELADIDADMGEVTTALLGIKDAGALKGAAASNAKRDAIAGAALSEDEQIRLYNYTFGEKQDDGSYVSSRAEDIAAFREAGMTFDQFLEAQNEYSTINEEYGSPSEKAVEFARWVNGQGLTEEQAAVVKDAFTYYSQIPQSGGYYEKFTEAGMNDESAYSLNQALDELEPLEGEDQVSSLQKYQAVVNSDLTESEQMTAMGELMPETEYEKLRVGSLQGVTPRAYVSYKQALPLYDADGNGSFKQEEVRAALDSLPLTTEQRAALWQMQNKSWKPSSNPYSVSVSQQVYDALNAEGEGDGGLMDWSGGITLPTAEELEQNGLMNWN